MILFLTKKCAFVTESNVLLKSDWQHAGLEIHHSNPLPPSAQHYASNAMSSLKWLIQHRGGLDGLSGSGRNWLVIGARDIFGLCFVTIHQSCREGCAPLFIYGFHYWISLSSLRLL